MNYVKASDKDAKTIFEIVQSSVKNVYPKYYPQEVVNFFCELHSLEHISEDINDDLVGVLVVNGICVGTGCYRENHITRVYVKPEYQGKGYGTFIMDYLEEVISKKYTKAILDASLPASQLYEKRGYFTTEHRRCTVENNVVLVYEIMEKSLRQQRERVMTNPKELVRIELKNAGFDIDSMQIPQRVYLLADDIYDAMLERRCGKYKYPLGGSLYVLKNNPEIGFIKSAMCSAGIATQVEDLVAGGVKEFIHVGLAGGIKPNLKVGDIVVTDGAYNDTAVAGLYGMDSNFLESSKSLTDEAVQLLTENGIGLFRGKHWTTDAGYHETWEQIVNYRSKEAYCVEMEGVGLFTIAKYRKCSATAIYIITDVITEKGWHIGWEGETINKMIEKLIDVITF